MSDEELYVEFSLVSNPADPLGHPSRLKIHDDHLASATTSDLCLKCPNALLCVSGKIRLSRCMECDREYVNDNAIPADITCEGFFHQPKTVYRVCRKCDEESINQKIREYINEAIAPMLGTPAGPETTHRVKEMLKARAQQLLREHGWDIEVTVECK